MTEYDEYRELVAAHCAMLQNEIDVARFLEDHTRVRDLMACRLTIMQTAQEILGVMIAHPLYTLADAVAHIAAERARDELIGVRDARDETEGYGPVTF